MWGHPTRVWSVVGPHHDTVPLSAYSLPSLFPYSMAVSRQNSDCHNKLAYLLLEQTACEILLEGLTGLDGESVEREMLRLCSTVVISSAQSDTRCWYILVTY